MVFSKVSMALDEVSLCSGSNSIVMVSETGLVTAEFVASHLSSLPLSSGLATMVT